MKKPMSVKDMFLRTMLYLVITIICMVTLYPYFAMFCTALKSRAEIFAKAPSCPLMPCGPTSSTSGRWLPWVGTCSTPFSSPAVLPLSL